MGAAYTPGLTVSPAAVIRRFRRLPIKGEVLVSVGDAVEPSTVVARANLPGIMQAVRVASALSVDPSDVPGLMKVKIGDAVTEGQILAEAKSFFGMFKSDCKSPVAGTIETISATSGNVGVRQAPIPIEVTAYVKGTVAEVTPQEGAVIETHGALIQGIFGVGGERVGKLMTVTRSTEDTLTDAMITPEARGAILVSGAGVTGAALRKASETGVIGIVAGGLIDKDLIEFLGYDIGVAITGHENINITLVITEGFGMIGMAARTFALLKSLDGKMGSINGATQIRAGVIRPEVIVPGDGPPAGAAQAAKPDEFELAIGAPIRVIREPYFGKLGKVSKLPPELVTIDSGATVRVLEADLADGSKVTVPRANVELIAG